VGPESEAGISSGREQRGDHGHPRGFIGDLADYAKPVHLHHCHVRYHIQKLRGGGYKGQDSAKRSHRDEYFKKSLVFPGDDHDTEKWDFGDCDGFCVTKGWYVDASVRSDIPINEGECVLYRMCSEVSVRLDIPINEGECVLYRMCSEVSVRSDIPINEGECVLYRMCSEVSVRSDLPINVPIRLNAQLTL